MDKNAAGHALLAHQPTHTKTTNRHAALAKHAQDAAAASRASTLADIVA